MSRLIYEIYAVTSAIPAALKVNLKCLALIVILSWCSETGLFSVQVNGLPTTSYQAAYPQTWQQAQSCPNGLCAQRPPNRRADAYGQPEDVGPVFVGGSFDFDLSQLTNLIEPVFNMLKNSEIIKVGTGSSSSISSGSKDSEEDQSYHRAKRRHPLVTFGVPEVQFINPHPPPQPIVRPDIYHVADSNQIYSHSVKRKKSKKRKKPGRSKIPPLISFVDDDEEDVKKNDHEDEDEEKNEEDEDKKDLEQLLELGLPKIILDELFGFGRGLVRPGKILTHLTFASIARGMLKRLVRSMFLRMAPRVSRTLDG